MPSLSLVPSLPAKSFEELEQLLMTLTGVSKEFQVDIVDGQFVPHTSWPFTESDPQQALTRLASYTASFALEIDCMVREPLQYLDTSTQLGAKRVIVHLGSTNDYAAVIAHAQSHRYQLGFAANANVPLSELEAWLPEIDFVQLMGIENVGQQGQPFDERTSERARQLRTHYPDLDLAVDGAVNAVTIPKLCAAGVNRFAPGSAIAKANDPIAAYQTLAALIGL